ncbi:16S rRNA (cytosine(967)-C(5))-methyltransferase [Flavobacteriaceae bacterium UJ101]|nr:16S rRNA (cytosine(967)-C(5))-methyltransferase [Flavobacteriaceae bacterium UJ101]
MKLHKNLCQAVVDALEEIFFEDRYADKVVQYTLKKDKRWGSKDRAFIAENIYDIVRWKRWIMSVSDIALERKNLWRFLGTWLVLNEVRLPYDWKEFNQIDFKKIQQKSKRLLSNRKVRESIPDWLDEMGVQELGVKIWEKELHAQNEKAEIVLRANRLKGSVRQLQRELKQIDLQTEFIEGYDDALQLERRRNVFVTEAFKKGLFEVQDASSQLVAPFLDLEPGMRVIDTCAGAGGKTLHIASLMKNKGKIIAMDIHEWKLGELKKRAKRNGANNIETKVIDSNKVIKRLKETADRVLIDAPCSGIGVLKRNPDTKWKLQPEFIDRIKKTQEDILESYSRLVKPTGKLVYATCSIFPSENEKQIEKFLEKHPEFQLEDERKILAYETGYDGFYMARLKRVDS